MTAPVNQNFVPTSQVIIEHPTVTGSGLKSALQFFDVMKNRLVQDYADPSPNAAVSVYGRTLSGQDRYGALGNFLIGQWFIDYSNIIETLSNALAFETKTYQEVSRMFG